MNESMVTHTYSTHTHSVDCSQSCIQTCYIVGVRRLCVPVSSALSCLLPPLNAGSVQSLVESGRSESRTTLRSPREEKPEVLQLRKVTCSPTLSPLPSLLLLLSFPLSLSYSQSPLPSLPFKLKD